MATNEAYEVEVLDVEYQRLDGKPWLARVYQPKGSGPFPTIVDVHGGAWHNGDRTNNGGTDRALASRGIVVAALDFRQPPEASYPASISDVNLGVRWLKAHAAEFNGTTSVGSYGNSSGGHQVVLAGLRPHDPRYAALPLADHPEIDATVSYVVAAWPVSDPLYRYKAVAQANNNQSLINAHLDYWKTEAAMAEGSITAAAEEDEQLAMPPILMMLKKGDTNHPQEMQDRFIATYRRRGGAIEVETFDGLPEHGMVPSPDQPETVRAINTIVSFIERHSS